MSDNSDDPEVELYEELVGDVGLNWNSPVRIKTSSVAPVAYALSLIHI